MMKDILGLLIPEKAEGAPYHHPRTWRGLFIRLLTQRLEVR